MPGMLIAGVIGATYGAHLTAQLAGWRPIDPQTWEQQADRPLPDFEDIDINPVTRKHLPLLGGPAWADQT